MPTRTFELPPVVASPLRRRWLHAAGATALGLAGCSPARDPSPRADTVAQAPAAVDAEPAPPPPRRADDPDLRAGAILLPGLINSADDGPFIDLLRAIDDAYPGGRIQVEAGPTKRVFDSVAHGHCDLGLPTIKVSPNAGSGLPYRFSTTPFGLVSFVVYSHRDRRLTRADLDATARGGLSLRIEGPEVAWGFPVQPFTTFESALRKIDAGRLDAFLWAQEEADLTLRELGLATIHRELYARFDDVFLLPLGRRGDFVDRVLTDAIERLRADGRLQRLYERIHGPWDPWQTYR